MRGIGGIVGKVKRSLVGWSGAIAVALHLVVLLWKTTMLARHIGTVFEVLVKVADVASDLLQEG